MRNETQHTRVIHKHTLKQHGETKFLFNWKYKILAVKNQNDSIVVWVETDLKYEEVEVCFNSVYTGEALDNMDKDFTYVGTVLSKNHDFVTHVYSK